MWNWTKGKEIEIIICVDDKRVEQFSLQTISGLYSLFPE